MTLVANAFSSYDAIGNREDLTDIMQLVSPLETPAYDRFGNSKATGRKHEWQTQALAAASANRFLEGDTYNATARTASVRQFNDCQVMIKAFSITDTQQVVDHAGRSSEMAYQRKNAMLELKRDMEWTIFESGALAQATGSPGSNTTFPDMRSVNDWQVKVVAQTGLLSNATGAAASGNGTTGTIDELNFNLNLQAAWDNGARINTVYCAGSLKRLISGWGTGTNRPRDGGLGKKMVNVVDFYVSDFGELEIVLDRYVPTSQMFLLDDSLWKKAFLVPTREKAIADTGLASNVMIWNQWTLEARNPTGNAMLWSAP
jgi:hypothetical protein